MGVLECVGCVFRAFGFVVVCYCVDSAMFLCLSRLLSLKMAEVEGVWGADGRRRKKFFSKPSPFSLKKMFCPFAPPAPTHNEAKNLRG